MDVSQYLEIFLDETNEHLQNLNKQILNLEQNPEDADTINEIFRAAHSLKGMAGTMGYKRMQNLTHDMENVFSEVRSGNIKVGPDMIDTLFQCLDALQEYTDNIKNSSDEGTNENEPLIKLLNEYLEGKGAGEAPAAAAPAASSGDAAPASDSKSSDSGNDKWNQIKFDDSQVKVLGEALKSGMKVYGINVTVKESCILKAARAFLVLKAIEEKGGEIVVSNPSSQDIEDEKFDFDFTLIVIAECPLDDLIKAASDVSEIEKVVGAPVDVDKIHLEDEEPAPAAAPQEEAPAASAPSAPSPAVPAASSAPAAPAAANAAGKPAAKPGKPVVNRTIRVDIEKLDSLMNLVSELIIAKNSLVSA
ncbi:MAG: Hpt domain-containing protein, partial [Lachnospiraceae bacterium]|nr:Hpt domain-containing protein [Lachnospiraceae bacterium]